MLAQASCLFYIHGATMEVFNTPLEAEMMVALNIEFNNFHVVDMRTNYVSNVKQKE